MAQYTPNRRTLGEVFALSTATKQISVPDWQRSYSWSDSEVKELWDDLVGFSQAYPGQNAQGHEYFLGSIVLVLKDDRYELLDGQQRLATATILLSVIRDYLAHYNQNASNSLSMKYLVDEDYASGNRVYKLTLGNYDAEFFRREVQDVPLGDTPRPEPKLRSHKLIRRAREFFEKRFNERYEEIGGGEDAYQWALSIQRILTDNLSVVEISSTDEDDAAEVFETLNNRGIDLSTTDLLRTLVLRRSQPNERDEINDSWHSIFELEDRVEEFLRHWWLSYYGDLTGRGLYKAFKPKVLEGELTPIGLTRQLDAAASIYQNLLNCIDDDVDVKNLLQDIKELGAKLFYPMLLSAYSSDVYEPQRKRVLHDVVCLFVRYNVVSGLEGTRLEPEVYDIARQLRTDNAVQYTDRMRRFAPDDDKFFNDFCSVDVPRQATARYLLRNIENAKRQTSELTVQSPSKVHVDHIYPQTPREGHRWDNHEVVLNRLGNLTLLSARLNQALRNAPFDEKKPKYAESQLLVSNELCNYEDWNIESIATRQSQFAEQAIRIWAFPQ